mmetsp:Transcript_9873/g.29843  ORF Transcript_9873/g.29843 Transcript_9873/m.29843 type:complete len:359 (+) Transcript_9873:1484-2560(+)
MWDVWSTVEQIANAMAAVAAHHTEPARADVLGNHLANFAVPHSWFARCNGLHETVVCTLHKLLALVANISTCDCLVQVSMVAVEIGGDVNVHNVAILQLARIWDAMADDLVHAGTHALGEVEVVVRARVGAALNHPLVHDAVELVRRHARAHCCGRKVEHLAACAGRRPDALERLAAVDRHCHLCTRRLLLGWVAILVVVVGLGDRVGDRSHRRDRRRSQLSGPCVFGHHRGSRLATLHAVQPCVYGRLVHRFVFRPGSLEAVLCAEYAVWSRQSQLDALGALQLCRRITPDARQHVRGQASPVVHHGCRGVHRPAAAAAPRGRKREAGWGGMRRDVGEGAVQTYSLSRRRGNAGALR